MRLSKEKMKSFRRLGRKKYRESEATFVVEGMRLATEAADSDFEVVDVMYTSELIEQPAGRLLVEKISRKAKDVHQVSRRELDRVADTVHAQGIVAILRQQKIPADTVFRNGESESVLVAFDSVSDPGNLGSMIRTCDWFGVSGIIVGRNSVELYNPKVVRSTMGSLFHLPVVHDIDLLSAISSARSAGYTVYVTDAAGEAHFDLIRYARRSLIVFGNEAWGVSDQIKALADHKLAIRRYGLAESLNVGVACGVILSALHRLYE